MSIPTAVEALGLPKAALRPSDAEAVEKLLPIIRAGIVENMTRGGCTFPVDPNLFNREIAVEVERLLRKGGWIVEFQQLVQKSRVAPNQQTVVGLQLMVRPSDASYDAFDNLKSLASTTAQGVTP